MFLHLRPRRGLAMATALTAIVLIGTLIAATFFVSMQDYRVGRNSLDTGRALTVAEYGQTMALKDWTAAVWNQNLKVGDTLKQVYTTGAGTTDTVTVTRIRYNMFWVVSSGRTGSNDVNTGGHRRTGMLVRMDTPLWPFPGAFSAASTVNLAGNYTGSGADAAPTGWSDCPPVGDPIAAVASTAVGNITGQGSGCSSFGCLTGTPQRLATPDAADQTKVLDGWDDLTSRADKVYAASATVSLTQRAPSYDAAGNCNTADTKNWGDPARATPTAGKCENYFPIIWITSAVKGSLGVTQQISQGIGQGIILVDGNLSLTGNFEWVGPIIVKGNVSTSGNGNKALGAIEALNIGCVSSPSAPCNSLSGTSSIAYSSCAIDKIMSLKAYPTVARHHAWADMF